MTPRIVTAALFALACLPTCVAADTFRVPDDYPTIQAGIDASFHGDTVLVADGLYSGDGNRDLDFGGKRIIVRSENGPEACTIECDGSAGEPHNGFNFRLGESNEAVVRGFTIRNGWSDDTGSAIQISYSSPTIRDMYITGCRSQDGATIVCEGSSPIIDNTEIHSSMGIGLLGTESSIVLKDSVIRDGSDSGIYLDEGEHEISGCLVADNGDHGLWLYDVYGTISNTTIDGNTAQFGAGIWSRYGGYVVRHCVISNNIAGFRGGGADVQGGYNSFSNCLVKGNFAPSGAGLSMLVPGVGGAGGSVDGTTITGNTATRGGGLYSDGAYLLYCSNSILWGNSADTGREIYANGDSDGGASINISYCDVRGGEAEAYVADDAHLNWGDGMIESDPLFTSGLPGDYCLGQTAAGQGEDSPCVDTGDPESTGFSGTTRTDILPDLWIRDMGYHYLGGIGYRLVAGPGSSPDNPPLVRVFPAEHGAEPISEFAAYGASGYGVNVCCGNVDGDLLDDIITGAGPGAIYGPHVRGFEPDGDTLEDFGFLAYGTNKYGVNVAAGDIDGDGFDEVITGAGPGAVFGPHVRAWDYDGTPGTEPVPGVSYFAYGTPKWGVNVSAGDIDGDGFDEIVTGPGPGAVYGPHVRGWDVDGGTATPIPAVSYFAYGTLKYGCNVSCGDVDGDGIDEIITGAGPGAIFGPHIRGWNYDGDAVTPLPNFSFFAWLTGPQRYGVNVYAGADVNGDGTDDLVAGRGPDPEADTQIKVFSYIEGVVEEWMGIDAFEGMAHGAKVAAGRF